MQRHLSEGSTATLLIASSFAMAARFGFDEPIFLDDDHALIDAAIDANDTRLEGYAPHALPLDRDDLCQLAKNAITAVFLPAEEKQRMMQEFDDFVASRT